MLYLKQLLIKLRVLVAENKKHRNGSALSIALGVGSLVAFAVIAALFMRGRDIALLNPKGFVADEQYRLLIVSTSIMLAFAAIVLFFLYFFAWRYREGNQKTAHNPAAGRSRLLMVTAWTAPIIIFMVLATMMLPATQKLEPQRSIESDTEEMTIRVIAMRWKWLFMYPEQDIATVNFVQIPVDTPVRFELTADEAPMNSFWIPHLGGMLYSMTEHVNPLNLMAHTTGDYDGGAAEINGHGFAGMRFTARVSTRQGFDDWVRETASNSALLDEEEYNRLLEPSENNLVAMYSSPRNQELFDTLLKKYAGSHTHYNATDHDHDHSESEGHNH